MDEVLRRPNARHTASRSGGARVAKPESGSLSQRLLAAAVIALDASIALRRATGRTFHRVQSRLYGLHFLHPVLFLILTLAGAAGFLLSTIYTGGYVVSIGGTSLGIVSDRAVFEEAAERVEARATDILGYDYTLDYDVSYEFTLTEKSQFSPLSHFERYLFNQVGEVMRTYVLTIDGEFIGASTDRAALDAMLAELQAPYLTEYTTRAGFAADVRVTYEYTAADVMQDLDAMYATLSENINGETTYVVTKGDTYSGIAYAHDMTTDELLELNPQASIEKLMPDDVLTVRQVIPYLSVETVEHVVYEEVIPSPVEEIPTDSLYQGESKVIDEGITGLARVTADVNYLNGNEIDRLILETEVLSEPTVRVISVGTKERPKTMPKGYFIWPVYGKITSGFGYRSIFGTYSFHSGIDIATSYGTSIVASDGGTVTFSGYKGSYGNLIIIDHGNGKQTYYGHCSSLLVSAGTKVYQGQLIARVGSTGRSTGNHCHFEIKISGTSVNPRNYLS